MVSTGVIHMAAIISELGQGSNNQEVLTHMSGPSVGRAKNHWGLADLFSIFWVSLKSWASFSVRSLSLNRLERLLYMASDFQENKNENCQSSHDVDQNGPSFPSNSFYCWKQPWLNGESRGGEILWRVMLGGMKVMCILGWGGLVAIFADNPSPSLCFPICKMGNNNSSYL